MNLDLDVETMNLGREVEVSLGKSTITLYLAAGLHLPALVLSLDCWKVLDKHLCRAVYL